MEKEMNNGNEAKHSQAKEWINISFTLKVFL